MGQKVNPLGMRLGYVRDWSSRWYADHKKFAGVIASDILVRSFLEKNLEQAGVAKVAIDRLKDRLVATVHVSKPGVVIGKKGGLIEKLNQTLKNMIGVNTRIVVEDVKKPELNAKLVADGIAQQLEKRAHYRKVMKKAVFNAMRSGAKGIKVSVSGRLAGTDIARREWISEGRMPLHTFRADIDYAVVVAKTTYGIIGVKVWIYLGDVMKSDIATIKKPSSDSKSDRYKRYKEDK